MRKLKSLFILAFAGLALQACYPGGPEYVEDYDMIFATNADNYDYSKNKTYVMPDTIVDISDPDDPNTPPSSGVSPRVVLEEIAQNMTKYGYTRLHVDSVFSADVVVVAQRLLTNNTAYVWNPWYPCYYCGWYPPSYSSYNYQTGTLYVTMIDVAESDTAHSGLTKYVWDAGINGLLNGSTSNIQRRTTEGVDQMFTQSPYLKVN